MAGVTQVRSNETIYLLSVERHTQVLPIRSFASLSLAIEHLVRRGMDEELGGKIRKKTRGFWVGALKDDLGEASNYILQPVRHTILGKTNSHE